MRDITLVAAWFLLGIWLGGSSSRFIVSMAFIAVVIGMCQHVMPDRKWRWAFFLIGLLFAVKGPRIAFIGAPGGEYLYLSSWGTMLFTTLWVALFPALFQELDRMPGMAGHLLGVSYLLLLIVTIISPQELNEAFLMSLGGLGLTGAFWSRLGHNYRRLGSSLSAMWGVLVAGTSMLGVSKGITFTTLMVIPLGLFAIPMFEASLHFASRAFSTDSFQRMFLYHRLIERGMDHPSAVRFITALCISLGSVVTLLQLGITRDNVLMFGGVLLVSCISMVPAFRSIRVGTLLQQTPRLWGVEIDNISRNYALSKVRSWLSAEDRSYLITTVNALSVYASLQDGEYKRIANSADLTLPDGMGLVWALKFLGSPVQERIAGIDFMGQLCRLAAMEGYPIFLLGSKKEIVEEAAINLRKLYPGLIISGTRHGYFSENEEEQICEEIRNSGARLLFVALGVPKQEKWLDRNLSHLGKVVGVGVGGSFDVISGKFKRAPALFQRLGLEWLFRLFQDPRRWKQNMALPLFVMAVFATRFGFSRYRRGDK